MVFFFNEIILSSHFNEWLESGNKILGTLLFDKLCLGSLHVFRFKFCSLNWKTCSLQQILNWDQEDRSWFIYKWVSENLPNPWRPFIYEENLLGHKSTEGTRIFLLCTKSLRNLRTRRTSKKWMKGCMNVSLNTIRLTQMYIIEFAWRGVGMCHPPLLIIIGTKCLLLWLQVSPTPWTDLSEPFTILVVIFGPENQRVVVFITYTPYDPPGDPFLWVKSFTLPFSDNSILSDREFLSPPPVVRFGGLGFTVSFI